MKDPKEREGMSLNEQMFVDAVESGHSLPKSRNDWEKRNEDFEDDGAHAEDDDD